MQLVLLLLVVSATAAVLAEAALSGEGNTHVDLQHKNYFG